jgi:putative effector of murein hydrolase
MGECVICLQSEPAAIQSGCACRNDAGLAHVGCLAKSALAQTSRRGHAAWRVCQTCTQEFTGEMAEGLALAWVAHACSTPHGAEPSDDELGSASLLALSLIDRGAFAEAEAAFRTIHACLRAKFGDDCPVTIACAESLANAIFRQGRHADAERILREVLRARTPGTALALLTEASVATCISVQGRHEEAVSTFRRVRAAQHALGAHTDETITGSMLVCALYEQGAYLEVERLGLEVFPALRRTMGEAHPITVCCAHSMGLAREVMEDEKRGALADRPATLCAAPGCVALSRGCVCARCGSARYCSRSCRAADSKAHKRRCGRAGETGL